MGVGVRFESRDICGSEREGGLGVKVEKEELFGILMEILFVGMRCKGGSLGRLVETEVIEGLA